MNNRKTAIKKGATKKATVRTKEKTIIVDVMNDNSVSKKIGDAKSIQVAYKIGVTKVYPPIYSYIYEREPEDMARIYEEHKNVQVATKRVQQIAGFKVVGNKLVAVGKRNNLKK